MTTLNIEGRKVKVDDAFLGMTPEEQNATVEEIAQQMQLTPQPEGLDRNGSLGQLNAGIASGLGAPVDLVAAGLRKIGVDTGPSPFGGSNSIRAGMDAIGSASAEEAPDGMLETFARGSGEAAGMLLPAAGVARGLQAGSGIAAGVGGQMTQPFVSAPLRATAAELAAGGGARVGGDIAAEASDSEHPLIRTGGELAGGLIAAAGPSAAVRATGAVARRTPVLGSGIKTAQKAIAPFTKAGGMARASDRVRSLAADPDAASAAIDGENLGGLTPAQQTGDPNLLALERSVAEANPAMRDQLADRAEQSAETLKEVYNAPAKGATLDDTRNYIEQKRGEFRTRLDRRMETAQKTAERRLAKTSPQRRESANSVIVRQEIGKAYDSASTQERFLWGKVPRAVKVPTQALRNVFDEVLKDTPRAQFDDIPADARRLLGDEDGFLAEESVAEMHGLYSRLRQVSREAMSGPAPRENKARLANKLADAILEDLGATVAPTTTAGKKLNEARAFSRAVNETFGQGTVGRIMGRQRTGGDAIAPEAVLASTVGRQGAQGAVAIDDISRATVGDTAGEAIDDFLKGRFTDKAAPRGQFSPDRAQDFQRVNREALDRRPSLANELSGGEDAARLFEAKEKRINAVVEGLNDPRKSAVSSFLKSASGDEIATAVFKAKDPIKAALQLKRQASKDVAGRALDGLKSGFLEHLMKGAEGRFNAAGTRDVSGNALFGQLKNAKTRKTFAAIFDSTEMNRLDRVASEFKKLEAARRGKTLDAPIDDLPNTVIAFIARSFAARQGARAGAGTSGASMLTAGFASKRMQTILENLTNDKADALLREAITDPDLFKALLSPQRTDAIRKRTEKRLTEWLIGSAGVEASQLAGGPNEDTQSGQIDVKFLGSAVQQ